MKNESVFQHLVFQTIKTKLFNQKVIELDHYVNTKISF